MFGLIVALVIGFIVGVLVGRVNRALVDKGVQAAHLVDPPASAGPIKGGTFGGGTPPKAQ